MYIIGSTAANSSTDIFFLYWTVLMIDSYDYFPVIIVKFIKNTRLRKTFYFHIGHKCLNLDGWP